MKASKINQCSQQKTLTSFFKTKTTKENSCGQEPGNSNNFKKSPLKKGKTLSLSKPKFKTVNSKPNGTSKVIKTPPKKSKESLFVESPKKSQNSIMDNWLSPQKKSQPGSSVSPKFCATTAHTDELRDSSQFNVDFCTFKADSPCKKQPNSKNLKSPIKNIKKSPLLKKILHSNLLNLLSPPKTKQTSEDIIVLDDDSDSFSHSESINSHLSKESGLIKEREVVLRRSPRKHTNLVALNNKQNNTLECNKLLTENDNGNFIDDTDDSIFASLISPVKLNDEALKKRPRDNLEISPGSVKKRKRGLSFSPGHCTSELVTSEDLIQENEVDLSQGCRCKVVDVKPIHVSDIYLRVKCLRTNGLTSCILNYPWCDLPVSIGDLVSIKASRNSEQGWCVTGQGEDWFILHSDELISCTTVVGSLFCKRRSVLSQLFKEVSSDTQATAMCVGNLVHQLLQQALKMGLREEHEIKKIFNEVFSSQDLARTAYLQNMDLIKIKDISLTYLPRIVQFIKDYVSTNCQTKSTADEKWPGVITEIKDIEENVWIPHFGLKGKIDATVQVKIHSKNKVMPLELKTGKPSNSPEHRGQVILYCLMLSQLGNEYVDSGLLLYLKDNVLKEVKGGDVERCHLLMLRNELASRLRMAYDSCEQNGSLVLPEPIDWPSACLSCSQLIPCTAALRKANDSSSPLSSLVPQTTSHLSDKHLDYVFKWLQFMSLEMKHGKKFNPIWANSIDIREKEGSCLGDLKISNINMDQLKVETTFTRDKGLKDGILEEGHYVIVSCDTQVAIACGHVKSISLSHVTLTLDRDLQKFPPPFHIDRYESGGSSKLVTSFLSLLLENSVSASSLRKFIIDLELPTYAKKLKSSIRVKCREIFKEMNRDQERALLTVLSADSFIIIKGMPGTGKSKTVCCLIQVLTILGHSILLTSHTHSAVDNILMRLPESLHGKILRLGSPKRVHPSIAHLTETNLFAKLPDMSSDQLASFYNEKSIVGVTCLGAGHPLLLKKKFDYCIVDEATQVCQSEALGVLSASHKFVLIGDPKQLPPLVISEKAKELGMGISILERLDRPAVTTSLTMQYRMNQIITNLANKFTYNNLLKCGTDEIASSTIKPSKKLDGNTRMWLKKICSCDLSDSVIFIDVSVPAQTNYNINQTEADLVHLAVNTLIEIGIQAIDIGVMAPYRAQVSLIDSLKKQSDKEVEVSTVDQFQGRDKSVIFYSATRNKTMVEGSNDILGDKNRLTVAITRAKHKFVIVGNMESLMSYPTFNSLLSHIDSSHIVKVTQDELSNCGLPTILNY